LPRPLDLIAVSWDVLSLETFDYDFAWYRSLRPWQPESMFVTSIVHDSHHPEWVKASKFPD